MERNLLTYIETLVAAILGFVITYVFTHRGGVGISPDSISYVSTARHLAASGQGIDYTGHPLIDFPLGFPLLLAAGLRLTHIDPVTFMALVCPLMFAVTIGLCGYMADRMEYTSRWYKPLLLLCIALSPALIEVYIMLWSETLFIIFTLLFMIAMRHYLLKRNMGRLLIVGGICALSCTIRYAGITLIGTGGLLMLIDRYPSLGLKFKHLFCFGLVSVSLLVINFWRNYGFSGTLMGQRQKGITPLIKNLAFFGGTFTDWFFYGVAHYHLSVLLGLVCIALLAIYFTHGLPALLKEYPALVRISLCFALLYSLFMVGSATISRFEPIDSRLLSPLYIPLVFGLAYPFSLFTKKAALRYSRRWWRVAALAFFLVILSSQLLADNQWRSEIMEGGIGGYSEDDWSDSPLVKYLQGKPFPFQPGYTLYSNSPEAVYFFTGLSCQLLPQKAFPGPIRDFYQSGKQYLVWFNDGDNPAILTLDEVSKGKRLKLIQQFDDGAVYQTED
jgi:hypothetical protein